MEFMDCCVFILQMNFILILSSCSQDVYHSHRPKEKLRLDSNNNENSVPKDFDTIDSNSNLGARSQRQRVPVANAKRKMDKAQAQSMLGKSANEVLKHPPVQPREMGLNHNRTHVHKPRPQVPTILAPVQGSNQDPPFYQTRKSATQLPPGLEPRKEQLQCEISGKEAISALSRSKSRECRQQIVEVYCKHKERALMPEKVPRYCPREGELRDTVIDKLLVINNPEICCVTFCGMKTIFLVSNINLVIV